MRDKKQGVPLRPGDGGTIDTVAVRGAYAVRRMCQVLAWLAPTLLCVAGVGLVGTHWEMLVETDFFGFHSGSMSFGIMELANWLRLLLLAPVYAVYCVRLMTDIISSLEGRPALQAGAMLRRHWTGIFLFSSVFFPFVTNASGAYEGVQWPLFFAMLALELTIVGLSSIPVIAAYLGNMRKEQMPCPTSRIALKGVELASMTAAVTVSGIIMLLPWMILAFVAGSLLMGAVALIIRIVDLMAKLMIPIIWVAGLMAKLMALVVG